FGRTPVVSDAIMICLVLTIFANIFQTAWAGINERTFVAVKPDGVQRRLVGEITRRFEQKGFRLVGLKLVQANTSIHSYWGLSSSRGVHSRLNYRGSVPAILDTLKKNKISDLSYALLSSNPIAPLLLWVVGGCCFYLHRNVVHGSDSVESAQREISLWFRQQEVLCWEDCTERWIYE
uniref:Nucleoside diphosphate kinase n=1 Tax=Lepisosteus oculatus TaxID=7918 RepID=W5M2I6_LEPOC